jgi:hypothetical protein
MSKTYILFPKVLKDEEADDFFSRTYWQIVERSHYAKETWINGETVDGIRKMEIYNGSDDNEWDL